MLLAASGELATWFVVVMGLIIVFVGLIAIILIISIVSKVINLLPENKVEAKPAAAPVAAAGDTVIPNRGEFVAAVSAVIAEELGTDITKIRIESIRKL
ncbi:MAG: OadG family protein [Lachnospiraceae bacterium]|nr:OadG family protein [Lachnospiraceae bacterium]